jgi:hypothetical protein
MKLLFIMTALMSVMAFSRTAENPSRVAPLILPDADRLSFDEIGMYAVGWQYRGKAEQYFPIGWSGGFDAVCGVALQSAGTQDGRSAFLLHPPWRGGTGVAFQDFRFRLPPASAVQHIRLVGATAMRSDALAAPGEPAKSDGATFRIQVNGRTEWDENRDDTDWKPFSLDLTGLAGQIVTVRFETDPGPHDNASFDFALWGGRELLLEGFSPKVAPPSASPPPLDLRRLTSAQNDEVAPPSGFKGVVSIAVNTNHAVLTYRGTDGTLQYRWTAPHAPNASPLGGWQLGATPRGSGALETIPLAGDARLEWTTAATFQSSRLEAVPDGVDCVSRYEVNGQPAIVHCLARLAGKSLVLEVSCNVPQITALNAGTWGPVMYRRPVTLPYYSGQVYYLRHENLFVNGFLDWTKSSASSLDGSQAAYGARTDGSRVPLHERIVYSAAWQVDEVLPNIPNSASPFREHLAGKIILDTWGGRFDEIARNLETLHDYGLNNCLAIIHDWQRSGYDNALPAHVPANASLGGEEGMKNLVNTAKGLGYDIALHENYVDYYPNYEKFDPADLSLDSHGNRVLAWYNPGTKIQSFAIQPHAILPLARAESVQIRDRYAPNADYLDVHSAVPPWFHVDFRAGADGAGTFRPVWDAHRQLWAFERQTYGGPVLGEGANHWYWSGLLDGVEAQFGDGWPGQLGQTAPLMVDFDLLKIHPLQVNHGMGYYERWWAKPTWHARPPMVVLDQYRMQEIIFGHAGFLSGATYADVPLAWLEHHLVSPVAARYATASPVKIEYQINGQWVGTAEAAQSGTWTRVRVTYDNALTVVANDEANVLSAGPVRLPRFGWVASGAGVTAWTAIVDGQIADYAQTDDSTFASARPAADWNQSGIHRILPAVGDFQQIGGRAFRLVYQWQVNEALPADYNCFVHFVGPHGIAFQNDHALPRATSTWKMGETVPDGPHDIQLPADLADGDYGVRVGLFQANLGRLSLAGRDNGESRIQVGTLRVRRGGQEISFVSETASTNDDIYQRDLNAVAKTLDFGDVRTSGSILVRREGGEWVLRALPRGGDFTVEVRGARFGHPPSVRCVDGTSSTLPIDSEGDWWRLKLNGAREYRWQ